MSNTYWIDRGFRWNPIDHMNAARANKPVAGGKTYKRATVKQSDLNARYQAGSHERAIYEIRAAWQCDKSLIQEDYRQSVFPEQYEEFI